MSEYVCAVCNKKFKWGQSEYEALKELKEKFGDGYSKEDCDEVCDDCYKKMGF